jgi:hypothetical protein
MSRERLTQKLGTFDSSNLRPCVDLCSQADSKTLCCVRVRQKRTVVVVAKSRCIEDCVRS